MPFLETRSKGLRAGHAYLVQELRLEVRHLLSDTLRHVVQDFLALLGHDGNPLLFFFLGLFGLLDRRRSCSLDVSRDLAKEAILLDRRSLQAGDQRFEP